MGVKFKVFVEPELPNEMIRKALELIPNFFEFEFKDWSEADYFTYTEGSWKNFIIPKNDYTIIFFDGESRKVNYAGGTIDKRVGIAVFKQDSIEHIYLRTYHELLHTLKLPADDMLKNKEFQKYLPKHLRFIFKLMKIFKKKHLEHSARWQTLYYNFLLIKYIKEKEVIKID